MVMQKQQAQFWCWAAVAVSVDHYVDAASTKTQCDVAMSVIDADPNQDGCDRMPRIPCSRLGRDICNIPQTLQDALGAAGVGRLRDIVAGRPLSFEEIRAELRRPSPALPVCVRIQWRGRGGHFVAIDGAVVSGGDRLVHVVDPARSFADAWWVYEDFVSAYQGRGRWSDSFRLKV